MSIQELKLEVDSQGWFYREAGINSDKPPVIMLHGIPAHSFIWCDLMNPLAAAGFRAIAPDWLGFGNSSKPDRRDFAYTPDAYINALEKFLKALEISEFYLIVQGFLGSVGIQYALRHPEAIKGLVILNTPLSPNAKLPWKMQQWAIPLVGDMLTQDPLLVDRSLEGGSGFVISDQNLAVYRKPFLTTSAAGRSLIAAVKNLQLPEAGVEISSGLAQWQQKSLIIWGSGDPWLDVSDAETLKQQNSAIALETLPEAKHYPQEHWSKEIAQRTITYLHRQG